MTCSGRTSAPKSGWPRRRPAPAARSHVPGAGQRRRGADALERRRPEASRDAADQQRHVGPLPAPVGVQLVEHQELQALRGAGSASLLVGPGQDQLQHHVVGSRMSGGFAMIALPLLVVSWPV